MAEQPEIETDAPAGNGTGGDEPTISQTQATAIATREAAQAERRTRQAIAVTLGCSIEEAAEALARQRDADAAALTEAERRERAADERERAAEQRETAAAARERLADLRDRCRDAGIPSEHLTRAVRSLALTADSTDDEIATEVAEAAALFTAAGETTTVTAPPAPPGAGPARPPDAVGAKGETDYERGQRMVRENPHLRIA